jgi:hypothetical protein
MNIKNIIILVVILFFLVTYLIEYYKKNNTVIPVEIESHITKDNNNLYINPFLVNTDPVPNIVKKYNDQRVNIITNPSENNKNLYDTAVTSANNNTNKNNLIHFINFLI